MKKINNKKVPKCQNIVKTSQKHLKLGEFRTNFVNLHSVTKFTNLTD